MCIFTKKELLLPPKELYDISNTEIMNVTKIACPTAIIYLSDSIYKTTTKEELIRFLKDDKTNEYRYVSEFMDCDDFSYHLMGTIHCVEWGALPFGILWTNTPEGGHAVNCFIDGNKNFWIIEPQNDKIYQLPVDWMPYLIII